MESLTYDQLMALFAETREQMAKTDAQMAKTDAQMAKTDAQMAKTDAQMARTDERMAKTDKQIAALIRQVAAVTDTIGRFAEAQVSPKILEMFLAKGIDLEETYPRVTVKKDGQYIAEIDLVLVNTIYSVVVEVKNTLRHKDVDDHIERLQKLQETPGHIMKGTTMYGAVAGMIVSHEVAAYAMKKGFYVIQPKGDTVEIANDDNFIPQGWATKPQ